MILGDDHRMVRDTMRAFARDPDAGEAAIVPAEGAQA